MLHKNDLERNTFSGVLPLYLAHGKYELSFSEETLKKYKECVEWIIHDLGDLKVTELDQGHITVLKARSLSRGISQSRMASIIYALKSILKFSEGMGLKVISHKDIKPPKIARRDVVYLTNEEVKEFVSSIKLTKMGLRFRALVEVLLGTAMRISEVLSLDVEDVDFVNKEAKIIGKGNKQRVVFFNDRAIFWLQEYLGGRKTGPLFAAGEGRLERENVSKLFRSYTRGSKKKITPHILRHTAATNLLFNGCPMAHIKEILGHERLETTCRYYLGLDRRKAKEAHKKYLEF